MTTVSLAELHARSYGAQDKMLAIARDAHPTYTSILHSHSETITPCRGGKRIELLPAGQFGKGIANIRLHGNWQRAHIRIGGHYICSTYLATDQNGFYMTSNNNCIPSFPYQTVHLQIGFHEGDAPVTVTYDIVETIKIDYDACMRFPIRSIQHIGPDTNENFPSYKLKLPFEHPVEEICLKTSSPIQPPICQISIYDKDTRMCSTPSNHISLVKKNGNDTLWTLDLHEYTLNLSRMPEVALLIENICPDTILDAWCTSLHTISVVGGILRIEFER